MTAVASIVIFPPTATSTPVAASTLPIPTVAPIVIAATTLPILTIAGAGIAACVTVGSFATEPAISAASLASPAC
jgi:hypothetical protein